MRVYRFISLLLLGAAAAATAAAQQPDFTPRMASVRADPAHMRTGPGRRYPIIWVYHRAGMPVQIIGEDGAWRRVRDWQGDEGWMHLSLLSGQRSLLITGKEKPLRRTPSLEAATVARLGEGTVVRALECMTGWCRVAVGDYRGWVQRDDDLWGLFADETFE